MFNDYQFRAYYVPICFWSSNGNLDKQAYTLDREERKCKSKQINEHDNIRWHLFLGSNKSIWL